MEVVQQKDTESIQNVFYLNLRYLDAKMAEKLKNRRAGKKASSLAWYT